MTRRSPDQRQSERQVLLTSGPDRQHADGTRVGALWASGLFPDGFPPVSS